MRKGRTFVCMLALVLLTALLAVPAYAAGSIQVTTPSLTLHQGEMGSIRVKADNAAGRIDWTSEGMVKAQGSAWVENKTEIIQVYAAGQGSGKVTITLSDAATFDGEVLDSVYTAEFTVEGQRRLYYGVQGNDVKELQDWLKALGYDAGTSDGIFGRMTEDAVKAFQADNHLTADGVAGPLTLAALESNNYNATPGTSTDAAVSPDAAASAPVAQNIRTLSYGMTGTDVYDLQAMLQKLGYPAGAPDGTFGSMTREAVMMYQQDRGLEVDGYAGPLTLGRLFADTSGRYDGSSAAQEDKPVQYSAGVLGQGVSGEAVLALQQELGARGYYEGGYDGDFGILTTQAVTAFQRDYGLETDGIAGPLTLAALGLR